MAIESTEEEREKKTRSLDFQGNDEGHICEKQRAICNPLQVNSKSFFKYFLL